MISLQDLGYSDIGLDGGWARCEGVNGTYHDSDGRLLVNTSKFPSFAAMNAYAHSLGLTSSWYLNCDQCVKLENATQSSVADKWYANDANLAASLQFDGIKFDTQPGGPNWNITEWAIAVNATGRPMALEDCLDKHPDGSPLKKSSHPSIDILHDPSHCPFNFYRTGPDNTPRFLNGMSNTLIEMEPFLNRTEPVRASRPGCWAYPNMLSIGRSVMQQSFLNEGCSALSFEEERTLFATWAIVSSPLILCFDVTNDTEVERLWPIIANNRALDINVQWAEGSRGEAGHVLKRSSTPFTARPCGRGKPTTLPSWVVWSKRLSKPSKGMAALAISIANTTQSVSVTFDELLEAAGSDSDSGWVNASKLKGVDVWTGGAALHLNRGEV